MQVLVNNRVVNYMMTGKGPMAVLLHGWADSSVTFTALTTHLKSNYTVVALDLAGFGNSQPPNSAWGLQEYAESVANTLTKLDIKNVHLLIGHSNGGAIAMYAVAHQLVQPKKLVLLASSGIRTEPQPG